MKTMTAIRRSEEGVLMATADTRSRRGAALLMAYFAAIVISFLVVYGFRSSFDAGNVSASVATIEEADYAAEYGANLAVSLLSQVKIDTTLADASVNVDWVEGGVYSGAKGGNDQRRIAGDHNGYEFRVQVRSADLAFANGTMPPSWLSSTAGSDGSRDLLTYRNTYEILATARPKNFADGLRAPRTRAATTFSGYTARDAYTSNVYGITAMMFGDNPAGLGEGLTVYNADRGTTALASASNYTDTETGWSTDTGKEDPQITIDDVDRSDYSNVSSTLSVDGEDHLLNTVLPRMELSSSKTNLVGAMRGHLENSGHSVTNTCACWDGGWLFLSYMQDDRDIDFAGIPAANKARAVYTPARPNPYVPASREFNESKIKNDNGHIDRQMVTKYKAFRPNNGDDVEDNGSRRGTEEEDAYWFYNGDYYVKEKKVTVKTADRLKPATMPVDLYLLGGKEIGNGRSVSLQRFNGDKEVYAAAENVLDTILYKGVKNGSKYTGVISQLKQSELIANDSADSSVDVIVASYAELKKFYTTHLNTSVDWPEDWRTVFVGEWTDGKYPVDNMRSGRDPVTLTEDNMLFDHYKGDIRRRSFSKHFPVNKEGKILVHEMKWATTDSKGKVTKISDTGTSGKARIWTGRYRWAKVDFSGKFVWTATLDGKRQTVYPREFTWEEITGQKTKRVTGSDGGKDVSTGAATYAAEIDDNGQIVNLQKTDSKVHIEGYPVTDHLGREVPMVETNTNGTIKYDPDTNEPMIMPSVFTEYVSVDASDPSKLIPVYFKDTGIDQFGVMKAIQETGNSPLPGFTTKARQFARRNYIEVVEEDGSIAYYDTMKDFEYLTDITLEDGQEFKNRHASSIIIGIEDNPEDYTDFDHTDMMFILNIVPPEEVKELYIVGDDSESSKYVQWWELHPDAGLTGGPSQRPVSSLDKPEAAIAENEAERAKLNYEQLAGGYDINGEVITDFSNQLDVDYYRLIIDDGNIITETYDAGYVKDEDPVYYFLAKKNKNGGEFDTDDIKFKPDTYEIDPGTYDIDPDTYDDIFEFVSQEMGNSTTEGQYTNLKDGLLRKQKGLANLKAMADNKGITLVDIDARAAIEKVINPKNGLPESKRELLSLDKDGVNSDLFEIRENRLTARQRAFLAFGGDAVSVAVGRTDEALAREWDGANGAFPAQDENHLYLAGEVPPKQFAADVPEPQNVLHRVMLQPEESDIPAKFVNDGALQRLVDFGAFDTKDANRGAVMAEIAERSLSQGSIPSLFLSAANTSRPGFPPNYNTQEVMDLVYSGMMSDSDMEAVRNATRIDEERLLLGWHRGGGSKDLATFHQQDSYVAAMLSADSVQPYTLAVPEPEDEGEVVAKIRHEVGTGENLIVTHLVEYDNNQHENSLPTFVFDKPFDGAGILVVNGNLVVKSTFAYYGLVVVTGDVTIIPSAGLYYRRDAAGFFTTPAGNRMYWDNETNQWFRLVWTTESGVNIDKKVFTDVNPDTGKEEPIAPQKSMQYKGEMVVQGQIMVGGDVAVMQTTVNTVNEDSILHDGKEEEGGYWQTVTSGVGDSTVSEEAGKPLLPRGARWFTSSGSTGTTTVISGGGGTDDSKTAYTRTVTNTVYTGLLNVVASEAANNMVALNYRDEDGGIIGRFILTKPVWKTDPENNVDHIWRDTVEK